MGDDSNYRTQMTPDDNGLSGRDLAQLLTVMRNGNQLMSLLISTLQDLLPRTMGSFTMAAATSKTVTEPAIKSDSKVFIFQTNAAGGTLQAGANALYHDAASNVAGTSFTVKTSGGGAAAGTETFNYFVINPA